MPQIKMLVPKPALATAALALILGLIWTIRPNTATARTERDALQVELQNGSFCPLSWSIAEFKLEFSRHFQDLLLQLDQARASKDDPTGALRNTQLAEILEETLAEARLAVPIESMEAYLLRFYRNAGLTNQHEQLRAAIEKRNAAAAQLASHQDRSF
jgi:hypothetical protein